MTISKCTLWVGAASAAVLFRLVGVAAAADAACAPDSGGTHDVARVIDGATLQLGDGREVRLMGALAPGASDPAAESRDAALAQEALEAVSALVADRPVTLRYEGRRRDRYGRVLAQVYAGSPDDGGIWIQERLIREGFARAYALPGSAGCIAALMRAEQTARGAGRGLWTASSHRVRSADDVGQLLSLTGQFTLVEGRVVEITRAQRVTYLNFGNDWRRDFTASLVNSAIDDSAAGAEKIERLKGKRVRVRGWIERRNGPMIVLTSPDEIEAIETADEAAQR